MQPILAAPVFISPVTDAGTGFNSWTSLDHSRKQKAAPVKTIWYPSP